MLGHRSPQLSLALVLGACLPWSLTVAPARAQSPVVPEAAEGASLANKPAAEVLFEEAVQLVERGELAAGCAKFEASEALDPAVGTLLHLGDCYERAGKLASAWARFREALSLAGAQSMHDRARIAATRADSLEPRLARVTINVPAPRPTGLQVRVGGTLIPSATWGSALPFDPGIVTVSVTAPGHRDYSQQLEIPATDAARVSLTLPALRAMPPRASVRLPPRPTPPAKSDTTQRDIGIGAIVLGGVGLGVGGALALLANARNEASLDHCPRSRNLCTARGLELREEATDWANAATLAASLGGAVLGTGLIVYFSSPNAAEQRASLTITPKVADGTVLLGARAVY